MNTGEQAAVHAERLSKRYGALWALQDCSITVPRGRVSALVGPNGAGKTTLLKILAGLSRPTSGSVEVLGAPPRQSEDFLDSIGYLAQEPPLYKRLTAGDHLSLGAGLNRNWDAAGADQRARAQRIPLDRPVSTFSGGQRAKLALIIALAKRPQVLLLDEPVAALDPLARREFLLTLAEAVADGPLTVIMSSHLVHDMERVCDHLILLAASRTQLCGDIDDILATHRMLTGSRRPLARAEHGFEIIKATQTERQTRAIVKVDSPILDPTWSVEEIGLEDVVLAYMGAQEEIDAAQIASIG